MDEAAARLILKAYRPGAGDDPETVEALRAAHENPELGRWFAEEQAFDRAIAAHLETISPPFGLRTRILAEARGSQRSAKLRWSFALTALATIIFLCAATVNFWRGPISPAPAEYAREMTSFIQLAPPLQMKSENLGAIKSWLAEKETAPMQVPAKLAALEPIGCRILSFRGHAVTLVCFHRGERNRLAHLFVVDAAALPKIKPGQPPLFDNEGGWMTATWAEGNRVYMIAMQAGRAELQQYLPNA